MMFTLRMDRMKHIVVLLTLGLFAVPAFGQQGTMPDSLSLNAMIRLVLERNPAVSQNLRSVEAARSAVDAVRSDYYPNAGIEASYVRLGPVAEFDLGGASIPLFPANNYDGHIGVRQKIYDFNKTASGVDVAASRVVLEQDRVGEVRRDLAYATVRSFYSVLFLEQSIRVQDEQLRTLNEYLQTSQRRFAAGTATEFDVLTTRVRLAAAETQKIDLQNRLRQEEITLRRLANLPAEVPLHLSGSFQTDVPSADTDSLMRVAQRQRPDFKTAADAITTAELQRVAASAGDNPSININLAYGVKNGYIPNLDVLRGNFAAGVSVEVPVFDGFKTRSREEEAQANVLVAQERKRVVEAQIRSDIEQALSDLKASSDKLQTTKLNVEQARRAAELAKVKYDAGVVTNLDLLDAETSLEQAKLTDLQSLLGYVLSGYELQRAIGQQLW